MNQPHGVGYLDDDLGKAVEVALTKSPADCRAHAEAFSWAACTKQFLDNVRPLVYDHVNRTDPQASVTPSTVRSS